MARLTITLPDDRHQALKEAAARRGRTIGQIVDDALASYGIKSAGEAAALVAKARRASRLREREALELRRTGDARGPAAMSALISVVDTNVVVSGLLTSDADAATARVLDAMLAGRVAFLLSVELLAEYRTVLLRPRIRAAHGLTAAKVDAVLTAIAANAAIRDPQAAPDGVPDRNDAHLWALLACQAGATLITGDQALLKSPPDFARVLTPAQFAELVPASSA